MDCDKRVPAELEKLLIARYKKMGWCRDYQGFLYICKADTITYNKLVEELKPTAIKNIQEWDKKSEQWERDMLRNRTKPNCLLVYEDIIAIECDDECDVMGEVKGELIDKALDELNIEIIKRIVRKTYPHKFS